MNKGVSIDDEFLALGDMAMNDLVAHLLRYKPGFLPVWLFVSMAWLCSIAVVCGLVFGLWFLSSQVEFL